MQEPDRLDGLYAELYRLHVQYGEDKSPARFLCDAAQQHVYSIEDDKIIPELYKMLGVADENRLPIKRYSLFYEVLCHIHRTECPDLSLGQLIACLANVFEENLNESEGSLLMEIPFYLRKNL